MTGGGDAGRGSGTRVVPWHRSHRADRPAWAASTFSGLPHHSHANAINGDLLVARHVTSAERQGAGSDLIRRFGYEAPL